MQLELAGEELPVGRNKVFEAATNTCSHCQRIVIRNPARERPRAYCPKCDHFICDWCEAERVRTGVCRPWKKVIDEFVSTGKAII